MHPLVALLVVAFLTACAGSPQRPGSSAEPTEPAAPSPAPAPAVAPSSGPEGLAARLPNGLEPAPGLYIAGQPDEAALRAAHDAGVRTVVNLRPTAEQPFDEQRSVEQLGMAYVQIPVTSASDLTTDNARKLDQALQLARRRAH